MALESSQLMIAVHIVFDLTLFSVDDATDRIFLSLRKLTE